MSIILDINKVNNNDNNSNNNFDKYIGVHYTSNSRNNDILHTDHGNIVSSIDNDFAQQKLLEVENMLKPTNPAISIEPNPIASNPRIPNNLNPNSDNPSNNLENANPNPNLENHEIGVEQVDSKPNSSRRLKPRLEQNDPNPSLDPTPTLNPQP